ncbi:hypothetical protein CR513_29775, partial [Mucuna pruriens]
MLNEKIQHLKMRMMKRKISKPTKDFESLEKENSILKKENENLKEEQTNDLSNVNTSKVTKLPKEVTNLRQSPAKFLLKYSRSPHDKFGLGFKKEKKIKEKPNIHCSNYRKFGHRSYDYQKCLKGPSKPSRTNPKGPKKI